MSLAPRVQFARRAGADVAYQLLGSGATNLVNIPMAAHLEQIWQFPIVSRPNERLATMSTMALAELRGLGMSDPLPPEGYTLEERAADVLAVMDSVGFDRAALIENLNIADRRDGVVVLVVDELARIDDHALLRLGRGSLGIGEARPAEDRGEARRQRGRSRKARDASYAGRHELNPKLTIATVFSAIFLMEEGESAEQRAHDRGQPRGHRGADDPR